jgi:hypothetical protein
MNGTTLSGGGKVSYVSSDWVIQGVGDYEGSGRAGILWRNSATKQVYIWLMNGTTLTSSGSPAAAWQIATLSPLGWLERNFSARIGDAARTALRVISGLPG